MAKLMAVEGKIQEVENFAVIFRHLVNGADVRSNKGGIPQFPYIKEMKGTATVSGWKRKRFTPNYPGFEVDVLNGNGDPVTGQTMLATVRATYND